MAEPSRARLTASEREVTILDAAITEFGRSGFHGASTAAIAQRAGCSEPMLYKHFDGKRDILRRALLRSEALAEAEIDAAIEVEDPLDGWLRYIGSGRLDHYRRMIAMRMLCATFPDDDEMSGFLRAGTDRLIERFTRAIGRLRERGVVGADADPHYIAWIWLGSTLAASFEAATSGPAAFGHVMMHGKTFLLESLDIRTEP